MANIIQIIEPVSETILKEFSIEDFDKAQNYAVQMDSLGIAVELNAPSLPETLALHLGANAEDMIKLKKMILDEIESHNECPCD
jgi:hypothetical protein